MQDNNYFDKEIHNTNQTNQSGFRAKVSKSQVKTKGEKKRFLGTEKRINKGEEEDSHDAV